ncbi:MAG: TrkH family potassium uptake protein [Desulfobacterales bacterium]|nr:TrkH family potassium uptake protein [Desulfobacterales bacterium]
MRWKYIFNIVGMLCIFLGISMIFPLLIGIIYRESTSIPILKSIIISFFLGSIFVLFFKTSKTEYMSSREGMAIVSFGWSAIGILGALPFYFGGVFSSFGDCCFESVSGFTTTGASVLIDIEVVPKAYLFWRAFIQWLGGMGIIVLSVAILPFLGVGGMQLYKAEVPSPVPDKLKPRIRDTATILWKVYVIISLSQVILLIVGGMNLFDSLCHTFTTMPTGGFSTKNKSVAHYDSVYFDMIIALFMVISGINFSLHYQMLTGKTLALWKDVECRFFVGLIIFFTLLVSFDTYQSVYTTIGQSLRFSFFQIVSIITTTGYATYDYEFWPPMSQIIIFFCMFIGASAGSTGGGMKCIRIMLCLKYCYKELFSLIHPRSISHVKIQGKPVPEDVLRSILGFLALYVFLFALCSLILASMKVDFVTSLTSVASCIGNVGPGFGLVGPCENYAQIPYFGKWLLIWCMLLGRLEIYTLIVLFVPEFWRK